MALASTATTIVSGAMAERTNLRAYMLYSFVSTLTTCFPTHWIWGKDGFLREMGVVDIAGCSGTYTVETAALGIMECVADNICKSNKQKLFINLT